MAFDFDQTKERIEKMIILSEKSISHPNGSLIASGKMPGMIRNTLADEAAYLIEDNNQVSFFDAINNVIQDMRDNTTWWATNAWVDKVY